MNCSFWEQRKFRVALLVLLANVLVMTKGYAQMFDFSAVCSTGQTLYYKITDATNHYVALTCPNYPYQPWANYTKPT